MADTNHNGPIIHTISGNEPPMVLSRDATFMGMALMMSALSKDPSTQVGAVIVGRDRRILSVGYNGTPKAMDDADFPWGKTDPDPLRTKYPFVIHAERNAVLNTKGPLEQLEDATMYVTLFPCNECMKSVAQSGIKRLVYYKGPREHTLESWDAPMKLAQMCGIQVDEYQPDNEHGTTVILEL